MSTSNPYESPTAAPEKVVKRRGPVAWGKGLLIGLASWMVAYFIFMGLLTGVYIVALRGLIKTISAVVLAPLVFVPGIPGTPEILIVAYLSGVLLHAAFWTAVFTLWRRRAGSGGWREDSHSR